MSETTSNNSTYSRPTTTVPDDWEQIPCVQYGFPRDKGPAREPKLRTIFEPIPADATTVSPIYVLTREQYERQDRFESGYEVKNYRMLSTELQDECEADDRVIYPIHIESDELQTEGPSTLLEWFREFVENHLDVPFHACTLYFSGNRSIHIHVPRFVSGEHDRKHLNELAEDFCEKSGAKLDCSIYSPKSLFRIPGVEHEKTGLPKVEIGENWDDTRVFQKVTEGSHYVPESYAAVLQRIFLRQEPLRVQTPKSTIEPPFDLFEILDSEEAVLDFNLGEADIETPLIEQKGHPENSTDKIKWLQYNAKEFSPYALADGNGRSVAVLKVKGTPYARKGVTMGHSSRPVYALVPAYFYGARGCAGEEFTKAHKHAPLQLSKPDYEKWDYNEGDNVVIIGGKSNNSRIFNVTSWQATVVGHALTGENASRQAALSYLESEGYDVGKAGSSRKNSYSGTTEAQKYDKLQSNQTTTEAAKLQQQAEQNGINSLKHEEIANVANRLLRIGGWSVAWEWLEEQFGKQFDAEQTWIQLKGIVEYYPDLQAEVPPKP